MAMLLLGLEWGREKFNWTPVNKATVGGVWAWQQARGRSGLQYLMVFIVLRPHFSPEETHWSCNHTTRVEQDGEKMKKGNEHR